MTSATSAHASRRTCPFSSTSTTNFPSSRNLHPGVLIVVQRFKNDLGLFVLDHRGDDDVPFVPVRTIDSTDVTAVLQRLHRDLERRHRGEDADVDPALATCVALGRRSPAPVAPDDHEPPPRLLCVRAFGMQLHGATFASMSRDTFLARLCALVPPPGVHMSRAYGVLASKHRHHCVVAPPSEDPPPDKQLALFVPEGNALLPATSGPRLAEQLHDPHPNRIAWSKLLARVFRVDVTVCARCYGPMRPLEAITDPDDIAWHLHRARAAPKPRPPLPGQLDLSFGA